MGGLVLKLAFMVVVIVFLFKIHKAVTNLQQKVDQLEQKYREWLFLEGCDAVVADEAE